MNSLLCHTRVILRCKWLFALAGVLLADGAWATIPLYQNLDYLQYTIPGAPPPTIDAKAFDNENTFIIANNTFNPATPFYETRNTMFYTNTGLMEYNTTALQVPLTLLGLPGQNYNLGYKFDFFNGSTHGWSDTFYNPGSIHGVSTLDGNISLYLIDVGSGQTAYELNAYGNIEVWATNIINPGTIDVSVNGTIKLTGRNVDLTGGQLVVEPQLNFFGFFFGGNTLGTIYPSSIGAVGTDTNADWNPGLYLTPTTARSSFVPIGPGVLVLSNSQSYLDSRSTVDGTFTVNRYVFVQNDIPNVPYKVYIDDPAIIGLGSFFPGSAHVEWTASYVDNASGNTINNYLYLTDDYALGATTNDLVVLGVPENFTFVTSPFPLFFSPTPQSFAPLPNGFITNNYACFFATLLGSTISTNVSAANPHGTITNLPGKIWITASNNLNLAFTTIAGVNYLNLNATNQFDGSPGASISVPFSDISLGVTNGYMVVSNVLSAQIPTFGGTIDAWSSDFFTFTTIGGVTFTNEYKVLLVHSALNPTVPPYVQNLYLHGTNVLTVSDPLNVYGTFYSDAAVLTLNTNQVGAGATSLDGELTWLKVQPFNANSGSGVQQMPNLLWVTNYGAIRVLQTANFGHANAPQWAVIPAIPPVLASGTLSETGTNAVQSDKVTIGTNVYTFVSTLTNGTSGLVLRASSFDAAMSNLIAAINGGTGSGTKYSSATKSNKFAKAGILANHAFKVTAFNTNAAVGNSIATLFTPSTASVNLTWSGPTLMNGMDYVPPFTNYTSINNHSLISDQGANIWTTYFESDGTISNGTGSFILHSSQTILTNSLLQADGDVFLMATNKPGNGTDSLLISNQMIQAGRKLTLLSTNISDGGITNGNIWVVGYNSGGGSFDSGFNIPWKPPFGDLLGTTLTNISPFNKNVFNVLSGHDFGISNAGYTNNMALGNLILDVLTTNNNVAFTFNGATSNNALYVDLLQLKDGAQFGNATNLYNFPWLKINTNMFVYYAQALLPSGISVAENIDKQSKLGANGGRLRWVYTYAGYYSSTNVVNADGTTNTVNTALAQSGSIDSDGDGIPNGSDPTPFFVAGQFNFTAIVTNLPPKKVKVQWTTIPNATNFIYSTTNFLNGPWLPFTNFNNWYFGNNVSRTNSAHVNYFVSPQVYNPVPGVDNSQQTNVWVYDTITNVPHYYKITISPWLNNPQ